MKIRGIYVIRVHAQGSQLEVTLSCSAVKNAADRMLLDNACSWLFVFDLKFATWCSGSHPVMEPGPFLSSDSLIAVRQ